MLCVVAPSAAEFYTCKGSEQAHKIQALAAALRKGAANPSDPCEGKPDAKSCDALDECTWCKAAAVPSSCFTVVRVLVHKVGHRCLVSVTCTNHAELHGFSGVERFEQMPGALESCKQLLLAGWRQSMLRFPWNLS